MAFIAVAKVFSHIAGPLVRLRQQHAVLIVRIYYGADLPNDGVGFGEILAVGPLALDQIRNRIQPQGIHSHIQPEPHHLEHFVQHQRVVEVQVRLVRKKTVPVVGIGLYVPGPVGLLGIGENDAGFPVFLIALAPDVELPFRRTGRSLPRPLKPRMLVRSVVDDELDQYLDVAFVRCFQKRLKIFQGSVAGMHVGVIGNVVPVVPQGRGEKRKQPQTSDA